jgi:hypothetical protein
MDPETPHLTPLPASFGVVGKPPRRCLGLQCSCRSMLRQLLLLLLLLLGEAVAMNL